MSATTKPATSVAAPAQQIVPAHGVSFAEAFKVWLRVALLSFGGPAGQIAVMHRIIVEERRWISEARFLHALNYCHLLPGPEAQQLAIYIGWLMHKTKGGVVAGALFVLPGVVALMALSWIYVIWGNVELRRRPAVRPEGCCARGRHRSGAACRTPRPQIPSGGGDSGCRVHCPVLLCRSLPARRAGSSADRLRREPRRLCGRRQGGRARQG